MVDGRQTGQVPASIEAVRSASRALLERWWPFAEGYWHQIPGRGDWGCFGTGYNHWGVQTNQKYLAAMAVLALDEETGDTCQNGVRGSLRDRALAALRFSLASHATGDGCCTDGTRWGFTWISALGIERMMHGVALLERHLTEADDQALRRVLTAEADHQLTAPVVAGLWNSDGRNKPESNLWNGAVCWRAATLYPDEPHAAEWTHRAHGYFLNGISIPADAEDTTLIEGRPLKDWHVGANFFPHYGLDHHGYLNVGYMVICLSQIAIVHYGCIPGGAAPPATLYHHAAELWGVVRRFIFGNGRLARIGGDTRQRYCYCQDYLLPTLVFAADHWRDRHALSLLAAAIGTIEHEQRQGADGGFLSARLAHIGAANPYYLTRLESDKAVALSMVYHWLGRRASASEASGNATQNGVPLAEPVSEDYETSVAGGWHEPELGAVCHRSPTRLASWVWRAAEGPQGLCLPPSDGHLAEWRENLSGQVAVLGATGRRAVACASTIAFEGGFLAFGEVVEGREVCLAEGWRADESARHGIVFAALPDGHTAVLLQRVHLAPRRVYLNQVAGVKFEVPNDLFGAGRRYLSADGELILQPHQGDRITIDLPSMWVNVDDRIGLIGLYGGNSWGLVRWGRRLGGAMGSILSDALCFPLQSGRWDVTGPAAVLDCGCLVVSAVDGAATDRLSRRPMARQLACPGEGGAGDCRIILVQGLDERDYLLTANLGPNPSTVRIPQGHSGAAGAAWADVASREEMRGEAPALVLPPGHARLFCGGTW